MKKVLITGVNSYVGNSLETWLQKYPDEFEVEKISVRHDDWKEKDFSQYDSIVHVAGIAHQKETKKNKHLYYKINRDLSVEIAKKSKNDNVKQFIFLSTMSVYGLETGVITEETPLKPKTYYGKSKKQAEEQLVKLQDRKFKVVILRPPMIYGKNCPGNYQKIRDFALKVHLFPKVNNKRSMIYIDNLSMYVTNIMKTNRSGFFLPQNKTYVQTSNLVRLIGENHNKKIKFIRHFNVFIKIFKMNVINKVFGNLVYTYDEDSSIDGFFDFEETIKLTEE